MSKGNGGSEEIQASFDLEDGEEAASRPSAAQPAAAQPAAAQPTPAQPAAAQPAAAQPAPEPRAMAAEQEEVETAPEKQEGAGQDTDEPAQQDPALIVEKLGLDSEGAWKIMANGDRISLTDEEWHQELTRQFGRGQAGGQAGGQTPLPE
ncbi:MAG: hypothetical protein OEZ59_07900 [Deltaproteobacteria bacterium]|nr:hypothetical protein [Deltaproteobacteria bacterium]